MKTEVPIKGKPFVSLPKPTCLWDEAWMGALCTCTETKSFENNQRKQRKLWKIIWNWMPVNMPGPYLLRPIVASRLEKRSLCLLQVCSMSRWAEPTCHACCSWILNHTKPICMWSLIPNNYTKWKDNMLGVNFSSRKSTFGPSMSNLQVGLSAVLCAPIETGRRLLSHPAICIWHLQCDIHTFASCISMHDLRVKTAHGRKPCPSQSQHAFGMRLEQEHFVPAHLNPVESMT